MNILHLTNTISEGGVETYLLQLLPALNKQNKCSLFVLNNNGMELQSKFEKQGVNIYRNIRHSIYNPLVLMDLMKIAKNYDIIHSHLFPTQYYIAVLKLLLFVSGYRPKFVTTEHCTTNKRRKLIFRVLEKMVYRAYDKIVCVSDASANNLKIWIGHKKENKNIIAILNGIDLQHIYNAHPSSREEFSLPNDAIVICMTARFFGQKDHQTLIRALSFLSDKFHLVLIGSGETQTECMKLSSDLGLNKRVLFLGRRRDVPSLIKIADLCVLSTHYEGLPVSILEYFAAAKPVIATDVDGVRELLVESHLLSTPRNPEDLAKKILALCSNKSKLDLEGEINSKKITKYTLQIMTAQYLDMYKSLNEKNS